MSVSHETTESSGVYWTFAFGNRHDLPDDPRKDVPIIVSQVPGLQGEAHQVDYSKGAEIVVLANYVGYASTSDLLTAYRLDHSKVNTPLLGELLIGGNTYGNATFLGMQMLPDQYNRRGPRLDGATGLYWCPAALFWRLRS